MLGKIVSINGTKVYVNLSINVYAVDNLVGKYVTFDNRYIGEIISMSNTMMEIDLIGELINGFFVSGNSSLPFFGSECRLSSQEEIDLVYGIDESQNIIKIGKSLIYKDYQVSLNINNFFANHFAIFGNTGSGKSYFVSKLLQGIFYDAKKLPYNTNVFLFDVYGEYQQAFNKINQVNSNLNYRVFTTNINDNLHEKIVIPFWLLSVDDIALLLDVDDIRQISIIEKALKLVCYFCDIEKDVVAQKNDIVARCLLDVIFSGINHIEVRNKITTILSKFATDQINLEITLAKGGWNRTIRQCLFIDETGKFADIEVVISYLEQFCLSNFDLSMPDGSFMYTLDDFYNSLEFALMSEGIFSNSRIFDYANILKIKLNTLINSEYSFYFKCNRYMNKTDYINYLLFNNGSKCQIVNFNIDYVDDRFAKVLVKVYSKLLFDFVVSLNDRASVPFHIILEEAHRYVQNDIDTKILGYNIFDRIAKEGRKYGMLLGIISQRPSEISETAVSQCSNFAIFKMFNRIDIEYVKDIIPGINDTMISKMKILVPGTCMFFGTAFKMPILTKVDMPNPTPYSDSCDINKTWYVN